MSERNLKEETRLASFYKLRNHVGAKALANRGTTAGEIYQKIYSSMRKGAKK